MVIVGIYDPSHWIFMKHPTKLWSDITESNRYKMGLRQAYLFFQNAFLSSEKSWVEDVDLLKNGGGYRSRTDDLLRARQAL